MSSSHRRTVLSNAARLAAAVALQPNLTWLATPPRAPADFEVALVGAGRQGRAILAELAKIEGLKVSALCDSSESRLKAGLRRAQGARGYASHAQLLDKEPAVQAVIVATPSHLHRQPMLDCVARKKHVYVESPLATTSEDAAAMREAARAASVVCAVGMQGRSNPIYALARSFLRSGAIRNVAALRAQFHKKTSWRQPAADPSEEAALNWQLDERVSLGLIGEYGVQQFDVLHWMLERYPRRVRANGAVLGYDDGRKVADTAACQFEFDDGRQLSWDATLVNGFEGQYELLLGEMGAIKLAWTAGWLFKEADAPTQGWEVYANRQQFHDEQGITLIADATKLAAQEKLKEGVGLPHPPLYYALSDFLQSIWEKKPVVCTIEEGERALLVGLAAHRALQSGSSQEITLTEKSGG